MGVDDSAWKAEWPEMRARYVSAEAETFKASSG